MKNKGITLVALVITIIILLILAAISIQAITNTGIFTQANNAKRESEIASIKEQIALDIYEKQLEPPVGSITEEQLETILGKYGTVNRGEGGTIVGITTAKGYEILLKDIYGGETVAESVPDGATVTPINDITTWLKTGGISKQYSYTTIEQVIADTTCTESLMNNENAMKYLARSTEFADAICASETTMTYLGQSAYVDDTVLNSDIWVTKISSSSYWDLIYPSVTVHSSASATITVAGKTFTSDATGNTNHSMPWGTFNISDSVSGKSFECTIDKNSTDVYVMPKGALYWYGNECVSWKSGGKAWSSLLSGVTAPTITKNTNSTKVSIDSKSGNGYYAVSDGVDITYYSKLVFGVSAYSSGNNSSIYGAILKSLNSSLYYVDENMGGIELAHSSTVSFKNFELDISSKNGIAYPAIYIRHDSSNTGYADMSYMYLE